MDPAVEREGAGGPTADQRLARQSVYIGAGEQIPLRSDSLR